MPGTVAERPSVSLSFANNFWGKDDAGVAPLLERMLNAKTTCDELETFYSTRAAIEAEYAKKLLALARKPLGSSEAGTLRMSLDVVRGEVESMGKAHQNIAQQMKTELDEPLTAFAGGMKERRKIVQGGVEKLLKTKVQQTMAVTKSRDRYEQDCLKIKGYLAQGHMVMGQEERKNKAKLEKTQIQLSTTRNEYDQAVTHLEETTGRWNKEWKAACDKFQDLEEERIDFMKSSLWTFANIASTVCVSDDASCEKIRLSLEECEVEKDITNFIKGCGTGQEIPDAPKFIDFCREEDNFAMMPEDDDYAVAQFQRTSNPAFRTASPQPPVSTPSSNSRGLRVSDGHISGQQEFRPESSMSNVSRKAAPQNGDYRSSSRAQQMHNIGQQDELPQVPYNEYPTDGMTQLCRTGPSSTNSSAVSHNRPISRDASEYSNPASFTSPEPSVGSVSPVKQFSEMSISTHDNGNTIPRKKSSVFESRSPFARSRSRGPAESPQRGLVNPSTGQRAEWSASSVSNQSNGNISPIRQTPSYSTNTRNSRPAEDLEPVDPRASFQLNVGKNVFDVASPDGNNKPSQSGDNASEEVDPIAKALADLKGVTKQASFRQSADRHYGMTTPAPGATSPIRNRNSQREAPPSYDNTTTPTSRLGAPQPAFTSKDMQRTTQQYVNQAQDVFARSPSRQSGYDQQSSPVRGNNMPPQQPRPGTQQGTSRPNSYTNSRAPSPGHPANMRSVSPRPDMHHQQRQPMHRATSPSPYNNSGDMRTRSQSSSPVKRNGPGNPYPNGYGPSGGQQMRAISPSPQHQFSRSHGPQSGGQMVIAQQQHQGGGSQRGRPYDRYDQGQAQGYGQHNGHPDNRTRSRSTAGDGRQQFTKDGRPILHFSRALYMYQAAIPEELSFSKGDMLAVLRHQEDGWWEAEIVGRGGRPGLVPSNYLST